MQIRLSFLAPAALLALLAAAGCGDADFDDDAPGTDTTTTGDGDGDGDTDGDGLPPCVSSNECPAGTTCSEFGVCVPPGEGGEGGGPEVELEFSAPVSSPRFVYVAMTELDSLTRIDGRTLDVASIPVGERPGVLASVPGDDAAVVLDQQNGTASLVQAGSGGAASDDVATVRTLPHMNRLDVAPTGGFAVAWFDLQLAAEQAGGIGEIEDIGSFQDVTLLAIGSNEDGDGDTGFRSVDATVGFRPRSVAFDDAGERAFIVSDDGVSIIDLADAFESGPAVSPPLAVTTDPLADPLAMEVQVTPAGDYAVIREQGLPELRVLSLAGPDAGTLSVLPLPDVPTDVDLAPDGARAYAVLRAADSIAVIDVPGDASAPGAIDLVPIPGGAIGSLVVSRDGARAISFTNAELVERFAVIDLDSPDLSVEVRRLQKSVRTLAFDPRGETALVIHAKAPGDPEEATTFEEFIDRSHGYSVVDVATGFAKLQITDVSPGSFAFAPDTPRAYLALDASETGEGSRLHTIELDTAVVRVRELNSPPEAVGVLAEAGVAFVSQRHPLGRITFVDLATNAVRTVTGFDLNGRVID